MVFDSARVAAIGLADASEIQSDRPQRERPLAGPFLFTRGPVGSVLDQEASGPGNSRKSGGDGATRHAPWSPPECHADAHQRRFLRRRVRLEAEQPAHLQHGGVLVQHVAEARWTQSGPRVRPVSVSAGAIGPGSRAARRSSGSCPAGHGRSRLRGQPIDAMPWRRRSVGVSKSSDSRGRSLSRLAMA